MSSTRTIGNNEVVNFIIVRSNTAFSVYIVKDDGNIVREFYSTDSRTLNDSKPRVEDGKTILGFFFDDLATTGEATDGGRVYSLAIYDKAVDPALVNDKLNEKAAKDINEPTLKNSLPRVETGSTPSAVEFIKNTPNSGEVNKLPEGTRIEWKENASPDTATSGEKDATILVTYPDNSTDEVNLKVTVISKADSNEPILKDSLPKVETGSIPSAEEFIKNIPASDEVNKLPEGTKVEWKENASPDTATPGEKDATILVTYPDGSTDEINLKVTVIGKADSNEPTLKNSLPPVATGSTPSREEFIKNTPTSNKVNSRVTVMNKADSNKPTLKDSLPKVEIGSLLSAEEFIKNTAASNEINKLPEGTKIEWKENAGPDTSTAGEKDATILVTYPDGSKKEINLKVTVISKADANEPILKVSLPEVEKGSLATNIPKTSDNTNIIVYFYILIASLVLIAIMIVFEFAHSLSTKLNNKP